MAALHTAAAAGVLCPPFAAISDFYKCAEYGMITALAFYEKEARNETDCKMGDNDHGGGRGERGPPGARGISAQRQRARCALSQSRSQVHNARLQSGVGCGIICAVECISRTSFMLEKLTIKGFKSIQSLDGLDLRSINLLIGGNGAGKSNLIEFFKMLRAMMGLRLAEFGDYKPSLSRFMENKGGIGNFLFGGLQQTHEISAEMMFNGGRSGYRFAIRPTADGSFALAREEFLSDGQSCWETGHGAISSQESCLPEMHGQAVGNKKETRCQDVFNSIRAWQIYQFHDTSQFAGARQSSLTSSCDEFRFDGGNLAAFLHALRNGHCDSVAPDVCRESYGQIVDTVRLAAPYFDDFILEPYKEGVDEKIRLQWRQRDMLMKFQPHHLSDGTLRFMCLSTVLLQPTPPDLIIIDEPELGLHPEAIEALAELVRRCSSRTQFILATQSPTLADFFRPEEVLTVNRVNGASVFERQSSGRLDKWLESYSIGQLWRKNVIRGGVTNG